MSNAIALTQSMNLPAPSDSLDAYMRQVRQIPVLSVEDERELAYVFVIRTIWQQRVSWSSRICVLWFTLPAVIKVMACRWLI